MRIVDFTHSHIEQALTLVKQNYEEERVCVPALPQIDISQDLSCFAENNLGVATYENDEMAGFLCSYSPWDNVFGTTTAKGAWSPIHAHGAVKNNRGIIYKHLYQSAAEKWVKAGATSHAITFLAHDTESINAFFTYGFGLRCIDAIQVIEKQTIRPSAFVFEEILRINSRMIMEMRNELINHLGLSPCFMHYDHTTEEGAIQTANKRDSRIFTVSDNTKIIGFIEIMASGENFICDTADMMNICGAYLLPEYRGKDVYTDLLQYVINTLCDEGYKRLGVDFESFNPTAHGFWLKHFTQYTSSLVRRIDERGNI